MLAFLLAWLWPFHGKPWTSFQQESLAFCAGLLMMVSLLFCSVRVPVSVVGFFLLATLPLLQLQSGIIFFAGDAWVASGYLAGFGVMLLAGYNWSAQGWRKELAEFLAVTFLLAATLSAWIALRQYFFLADSIWEINLAGGRPYANLAQPNHLATLLGLGVAGCVYLYERHLLSRASAALLVAFLIVGLTITQSRTPWVTTLAIMVFWALKARQCSLRLSQKVLCLWALFYLCCILGFPLFSERVQLGGANLAWRAMSLERWELWLQLWHAVWHGPAWGYGWGQISLAQVGVTLNQPLAMMTDYSHNIVLDILLWNGLVPGAVVVLVVGYWLVRLAWLARDRESLFSLLAAGFILVHSMLEFPFAYAYFLLPLAILLGMVAGGVSSVCEWRFSRVALISLLVGAVWLFFNIYADYKIVEKDYFAQRMAAAKVVGFEGGQQVSEIVVLTQLRELQRFRRESPREGMSFSELGWMERVVHRYPYLSNLYRYSLALTLNGRQMEAEKYLMVIRGLHGEESYQQAVQQMAESKVRGSQ